MCVRIRSSLYKKCGEASVSSTGKNEKVAKVNEKARIWLFSPKLSCNDKLENGLKTFSSGLCTLCTSVVFPYFCLSRLTWHLAEWKGKILIIRQSPRVELCSSSFFCGWSHAAGSSALFCNFPRFHLFDSVSLCLPLIHLSLYSVMSLRFTMWEWSRKVYIQNSSRKEKEHKTRVWVIFRFA